ncbi:MAG: nitrate reductase, partial [Pseudomonadota bacterium]
MKNSVKTTCPYCGVGCGVIAKQAEEQVLILGDTTHPANFGRLCSKGSALEETLDLDNRLLQPHLHGKPCDWDAALSEVANGFSKVIEAHGPDAVAFYISGQLLTEDYYVANKLLKGMIGTANVDTNSRLCMASSVVGHKRAFGSDTVPGNYEDLEQADLVVLTGSNLAWCHPVLFQRLAAAKEARPEMRVVVIDPRRTATCDIADLHLPLQSGSDVWLFNSLLGFLAADNHLDERFIGQSTEGLEQALEAAQVSPVTAARECRVPEASILRFFQWFAETTKVVTVYSQGVNQSSSGTDKVNSILNCHLATGRIGKPGMGPFSVTGQPNAMGGREVGGLANQLAAHMDFSDEHRAIVNEFWQADNLATEPGLKAVDMFDAVLDGRIKAIWIMATNPVVSMPEANKVKRALEQCELVVVSDCVRYNDTIACADALLPALAWGEKSGTVTNSERCISRQRAFLPAPGEAKADWWIISEVAKRMGYTESFSYESVAAIFREHAALSAFKNNGTRDFDISGLQSLSESDYDNLQPIQWPVTQNASGQARLFGNGKFFTPTGKAKLLPIQPHAPQATTDKEYPLILNTGRIRDQWHTMTRTGKTPRLLSHISEPYVDIHPKNAEAQGIKNSALVEIESIHGRTIARACLSSSQTSGTVFMPIHWNAQTANQARVGTLIGATTDPFSGQPEFKHTAVSLKPCALKWQGFLISRMPITLQDDDFSYRASIPGIQCYRYELAGQDASTDWQTWFEQLTGVEHVLSYHDTAQADYRFAHIEEEQLMSCLFIARDIDDLPSRQWLQSLFAESAIDNLTRKTLLSGRPGNPKADPGPTVCSC